MKGFAYSLDLMLATSILIFLATVYFSLSLEQLNYPSYERKAYMLDEYMLGFITSAEKTSVLNESVVTQTELQNALNSISSTRQGPIICIYVEIYNSTEFYSSSSPTPLATVYKPGCSSIEENARVYYRHVYREYDPGSGYYVFKFYAWYK